MKNTNAVIIAPFFTMLLLALPIQAHADWSNPAMHPVLSPNFSPTQAQPVHHEVHVTLPPPRLVEPRQVVEHHEPQMPDYFRHDADYYGHVDVPLPYADLDSPFTVPDGFQTVVVNGEAFYYNRGIFYSQVGGQLTAIPAVLGAVVDYIPQDYQIVMADGVHYLVTGGVYYQRVDQGFEVVQAPGSDQDS